MWENHPYYPISQFYKEIFGQKVYKISVSTDSTCPNRGKSPCIFCDEWGSAAYHHIADKPLTEQVVISRERIRKRYKANQFLVYFQSYTSTYKSHQILQNQIEEVLAIEDVMGIVLGTRPDTLSEELIQYLASISKNVDVQVELGAQTFREDQLAFLQRGHTALQTLDAIERLTAESGIKAGVHLIFGLPGETTLQLVQTAKLLNAAGIATVKLHNLHVLKNTPLEILYKQGEYRPPELNEYADKVVEFLKYLDPAIAVHRLAATANRWDELVAPEWTKKRMEPVQFIENRMKEKGVFQGREFVVDKELIPREMLKQIQEG